MKDDLLKYVKHIVKKYKLTKSAFIFDLMELYKYDQNKYCEQLKKEKRFTIPEETREYKNERYLEFKEKGWTKRTNKPKKVKIEQTPLIEEKQTEKNIGEVYQEMKKNLMIQEHYEESIKIDGKIPDPDDLRKHIKWLNKQLIEDGHEGMEHIQESNESEISEEILEKIENGSLEEQINKTNKDLEWECDEEKKT
jgi:hypothetical protein